MTQYILLYLMTVPVFFIIDLLWLGVIANNFYQTKLGHLTGDVNWTAAIIFYLVYIIGILIFAVIPGIEAASFQKAVIWGALFGFFTYATYDMTNLATLNNWPTVVVIVDIIWGTVLSGSVAAVSYYIGQMWLF